MAFTATVSHATASDGTFSVAGKAAWDGVGAHSVTVSMASGFLLGRGSAGAGSPEEITIGSGLTLTGTTLSASGGATLNGITAATGAVTIASGNNTGIVWNWANTTDSTVAHTYGETSAATGGTSTSGVPNQVLLKLATLAASTQSPLSVYVRGVHALSFDPANPRILLAPGSVSLPSVSFAESLNTGMYEASNQLRFTAAGVNSFSVVNNRIVVGLDGSAPAPALLLGSSGTSGLFSTTDVLGFSVTTIENSRLIPGAFQVSKSTADAVAYTLNSRKSRGTVASPTVITTGDDLLTIKGFGYLGATNTYQEGARILFDSTGTISDATNGIGGILSFLTRKQGVDTAVVERFRVDDAGHIVSIAGTANTPTITAGGGTNPTITGTDNAFTVTIGTGGIATSVEVTFGTAYTNAPVSSAQSDTDVLALKSTPLTNKVTISAGATPFTAGSNIDVICIGRA